jgi:hypothetical protein
MTDFVGQIISATKGAWSATQNAVQGGGTVFSGDAKSLIVDPAGNVFTGPNSALSAIIDDGQLFVTVTDWSAFTQVH